MIEKILKVIDEVFNELTDKSIDTENEETFRECELIREALGNATNTKEWLHLLRVTSKNNSKRQKRSNDINGEA